MTGEPAARRPTLTRQQGIGRRLAFVNMAVVGVQLAVSGLLLIVNLLAAPLSGQQPHPTPEGAVRRTLTSWRGLMPIDVPWWVFLLLGFASLALLILIWNPKRHYVEPFTGKVVVMATPAFFGLFAVILGVLYFLFGQYYVLAPDWYLPLIPALFSITVGVVGIVRSLRLRRKGLRRGRR